MQTGQGLNPIFLLVGILVIFYFMIMRPEQKKQKERQKMIVGIDKNDEIVTVGGIHGTVVNVKESTFIIRIDDNTRIEIDKTSVSHVTKKRV